MFCNGAFHYSLHPERRMRFKTTLLMENHHYFLLIFLFVRLLVYFNKEQSAVPEPIIQNIDPPVLPSGEKKILFFVNGNPIRGSYLSYYLRLLRLQHHAEITDRTIHQAHYDLFEHIIAIRQTQPLRVDVAELRAAKSYLLDRWMLLAHKN